jgi:hypothetical protein
MIGRKNVELHEPLEPAIDLGTFNTLVHSGGSMLDQEWRWGLTKGGSIVSLEPDGAGGVKEGGRLAPPYARDKWGPTTPEILQRMILPRLRRIAAELGIG